LNKISARDFGRGFASHWILQWLTYDDAVTRGALSMIPESAYGYSDAEVRRFAGPLGGLTT
jgi:hypothetical protein